MRKFIINQKGVTLIEVLAVILLVGLIGSLIMNVQVAGSKQYNDQLAENMQLSEVSYVLKVLTKEMRKTSNITPINSTHGVNINGSVYKLDETTHSITKNDVPFASNILEFTITFTNGEWQIEIVDMKGKKVHTSIVVRSGN